MLQILDKQTDNCPLLWPAAIENQVLRFINLRKYHLFLTRNLSDGIEINKSFQVFNQCSFNGLSIFLTLLQHLLEKYQIKYLTFTLKC